MNIEFTNLIDQVANTSLTFQRGSLEYCHDIYQGYGGICRYTLVCSNIYLYIIIIDP